MKSSRVEAGMPDHSLIPELPGRRAVIVLAVLAAVSLAGYLFAAAGLNRIGFPLDDAWIHQTYARNLAVRGEWSFIPGQPSAGSTAPLWSALLATGHWAGLGPYASAFILGWAALLGIGLAGMLLFRRLGCRPAAAFWVGVLLVFEWRMAWAAASGMETALAALLVLAVLGGCLTPRKNWLLLGALVGLSVWIRPDCVTLAGPVLWAVFFEPRSLAARARFAGLFAMGALLVFLPYLAFNYHLAGTWWPNTYFAKQAEYAVLLQQPLLDRILTLTVLPLVGVGAVLLPGFLLQVGGSLRRKAWVELGGPLWLAGYLLLYALRLPVIYQHGRYLMPAMPVYLVWALAGMIHWLDLSSSNPLRRIAGRAWALATAAVTLVFWVSGARAYAQDVAVIETEMVAAAHWVAENTPQDALVAAHDIGALGYFGGRRLLDLAGLVSPEVIPFIRDEHRLEMYLDTQQAGILVTFPDWYPHLVRRGVLLYSSGGQFAPAQGSTNMNVYRWPVPGAP